MSPPHARGHARYARLGNTVLCRQSTKQHAACACLANLDDVVLRQNRGTRTFPTRHAFWMQPHPVRVTVRTTVRSGPRPVSVAGGLLPARACVTCVVEPRPLVQMRRADAHLYIARVKRPRTKRTTQHLRKNSARHGHGHPAKVYDAVAGRSTTRPQPAPDIRHRINPRHDPRTQPKNDCALTIWSHADLTSSLRECAASPRPRLQR